MSRIEQALSRMTSDDIAFVSDMNFRHRHQVIEERIMRFYDLSTLGGVSVQQKAVIDALFVEMELLLEEAERLAKIPYRNTRKLSEDVANDRP